LVPVRQHQGGGQRVAAAAIGELIAGPRNGLLRLVSPGKLARHHDRQRPYTVN
jgi:hypothetical protein